MLSHTDAKSVSFNLSDVFKIKKYTYSLETLFI